MKIETILNGERKRGLFDSLSNEFNKTPMDEKLTILASLNYWKLIDQTIKEYQEYYSEPDKRYIIDLLKPTLQSFLKLLYENYLPTDELEKLNLNETIKELKKVLKEKVENQYSLRKLIESYIKEDNDTFKNENRFFRIDFQKDLTEKLKQRDSLENKPFQESYTHLYTFLRCHLIPDFRNNHFQGYAIDMGMDYQTEYTIKHYLQIPNKDNYLRAIEYAVNILYLDKEPYHKFFLFRINFHENDIIRDFRNNNKVSVRFDTPDDFEDWERLNNGSQPKQQYIQRWKQLNKSVQENDTIVIASYRNLGYKIGVIPQKTEFEKIETGKAFYTIFRLENIKEIDLDLHPFVQTLLPANVTISQIKRKNIKLRKLYYEMATTLPNNEFDDIAYEIMVSEWLRTNYAPEGCRLQYQLLKTGGNKKDIDIYGVTVENEKLIAQVSGTNDLKLIGKKIDKLRKYEGFKKLFFFDAPDKKTNEYEIIDMKRVISDLKSDKLYQGLINELE